ncbi:glycosyltransferase family 4 protein [Novipirellula sp.]|uniref:glycosyltransferase family 4 protein n=1 Tax=Novipirellula sp. TaxID=2795430 RepID=UPI0035637582
MKVCFICNEYPPGPHGGIGTCVQVLARELAQSGHQVRVAGMYPRSYPSADYEEDQGVRVWRFRRPPGPIAAITSRYHLYKHISRWCQNGEVDIVEVPDWAGWAAGWPKLPVPVVARLNGSASYFAAEINGSVGNTTYWLERASLRRVDYWCSVSNYTAAKTRDLFKLRRGPDAILYNPVEIQPAVAGNRTSNQDVVFTGTLTEKKGVIPLFKAWHQVLAECNDAKLHVYGKDRATIDGQSMQQYLCSLLSSDELQHVIFHGHLERDALFQVLRQARLAVFPSYAEAFALAPLEAMACGCPTIASKRGAGSELMRDDQDGLLVDPDNVDEISAAIIRLLQNDQVAARLGEAGRARIEQTFSIHKLRSQNEAFYRQCIEAYSQMAA